MSKDERYYVEYLGWKETAGLYGREFTDPIVEQLLRRTRHSKLPKLTLKLNREHIAITQEVFKKKSRPEKVRYPLVAARDVAFSAQSSAPDADVVACIFLGYNPLTQCAVHVHVYRFDSANTARLFDCRVRDIIGVPEYRQRMLGVESYLAELGHVRRRRSGTAADGGGGRYGVPPPRVNDDQVFRYLTPAEALRLRGDIVIRRAPRPAGDDGDDDDGRQNPFESVKEELEYKLKQRAPLLLPPKDYDTVVRRHGHVDIRDEVKSRHASIVGSNAIFASPKAKPFYDGAPATSAAAAAAGSAAGESWMRRGAADGVDSGGDGGAEREVAAVLPDCGLAVGAEDSGAAETADDVDLSSGGGGIYSEIVGPRDGGGGGETDSDMAMYSYEFSYGHGASGDRRAAAAATADGSPAASRIGRTESLHSWQGHVAGHAQPKARTSRSLYVQSAR